MSLVEKALEKMQAAARVQAAAPAAPVAPKPVSRAPSEVSESAVRRVAPPARVVSLNAAVLRQGGMLPPEHEERVIGRQFRTIKRPLISSALGRGTPQLPNGRLIMVASALPGDGKSFTSVNLAISMAKEADLSVLLVDADVAKQHLSTLFSINNEPGLLDALREPSGNLEALVLPTDVPSLSVLSAGRRADNATELLSSNRMEEVSRQLAASDPHRIIIFDSTPLMLTTESQALAHACGQIVMVVRAGVTPQSVVLDAVTSLGDRPISFILNQSVAHTAANYYYGYEDGREGSISS
jgi:exopolysaccharide/PEP-CTERM locus tyrosine autokinase